MYEIISWVLLVASLFELHEGQLKLFAISIALSGLFGLVAG